MRMIFHIVLVVVALIALGCRKSSQPGDAAVSEPADTVRLEFDNYKKAMDYFATINYTPEAWAEGIREVPLAFLMHIPDTWRTETTKEISIQMKKRIFFRVLAPLALYSNELILQEREQLQTLVERNQWDTSQWVHRLAMKYKVIKSGVVEQQHLDELIRRVDIIPPSLALAQTAEESGWGTSRFAAEGNALFGQWAWGKEAMKPKFQREGKGDYGLARFDTPLASMEAYMLNLNTHPAYKDLRKVRAAMRARNELPGGKELARTLTKYSERGEEYVESLQSMMRINRLDQMDSAYLKMNPVILLIPVSKNKEAI